MDTCLPELLICYFSVILPGTSAAYRPILKYHVLNCIVDVCFIRNSKKNVVCNKGRAFVLSVLTLPYSAQCLPAPYHLICWGKGRVHCPEVTPVNKRQVGGNINDEVTKEKRMIMRQARCVTDDNNEDEMQGDGMVLRGTQKPKMDEGIKMVRNGQKCRLQEYHICISSFFFPPGVGR